MASPQTAAEGAPLTGGPLAINRTTAYLRLLLLAAVIGPLISVIAYCFLASGYQSHQCCSRHCCSDRMASR
jgi:hypothetical protein